VGISTVATGSKLPLRNAYQVGRWREQDAQAQAADLRGKISGADSIGADISSAQGAPGESQETARRTGLVGAEAAPDRGPRGARRAVLSNSWPSARFVRRTPAQLTKRAPLGGDSETRTSERPGRCDLGKPTGSTGKLERGAFPRYWLFPPSPCRRAVNRKDKEFVVGLFGSANRIRTTDLLVNAHRLQSL
jgi:hypothetical protein